MRRFGDGLVLFAAVLGALSCGGGTFFVSTGGNGVSFLSVSGTVSIVQLTLVNDGQVTVVTVLNDGTAQTLNFCGNVVQQFPSGAFVTITFVQNGSCNNLVGVR